jgi:hypothetical protein
LNFPRQGTCGIGSAPSFFPISRNSSSTCIRSTGIRYLWRLMSQMSKR